MRVARTYFRRLCDTISPVAVSFALLACSAAANAAEVTASLVADYVHGDGAAAVLLDFDGLAGTRFYASAIGWLEQASPPNNKDKDANDVDVGLGGGYLVYRDETWRIGLGAMYLNHRTVELSAGRFTGDIRVVWTPTDTIAVTLLRHMSDPFKKDNGWNFSGIGIRWQF